MVDGQLNNGAIIQARMTSSRLPGKVLMKLPVDGTDTIIDKIIKQASQSKLISKTIVATSSEISDDAIFSSIKGTEVYRGSLYNVLERFYNINNKYQFRNIVRLTGDNPFIDPKIIDSTLLNHIEKNADYTLTKGLPLGMNIEIFSAKAINQSYKNTREPEDLEHLNPYILKNASQFNINYIELKTKINNLRLTIDYPSDYSLANILFQLLEKENASLELIERYMELYPWLIEINQNNVQKTLDL